MAIDGLRPEDHEVVCGGSWLKSVNASPKESTPFLRTVRRRAYHYSANIGRDDFVQCWNNGFKIKVLPVRG